MQIIYRNHQAASIMAHLSRPDPLIVQQLRDAALAGKFATQLLAQWRDAMESVGGLGTSVLNMYYYFEEVFPWDLHDEGAFLTAWQPFCDGGSAWTDEMIDERMAPLLEDWRTNPRRRPELGDE